MYHLPTFLLMSTLLPAHRLTAVLLLVYYILLYRSLGGFITIRRMNVVMEYHLIYYELQCHKCPSPSSSPSNSHSHSLPV